MTNDHDEDATSAGEGPAGVSRRRLLASGAGLGAAGAAVGILGTAGVVAATSAAPETARSAPSADGPLVVHVRNAATGEIDLFSGTTHVRVHDTDLAAHLMRAAG